MLSSGCHTTTKTLSDITRQALAALQMPRNAAFLAQDHEPFRSKSSLELQHDHITGPLPFLNPTRATFRYSIRNSESSSDIGQSPEDRLLERADEQVASNAEFQWRSRDNRKGRHTLVVAPASETLAPILAPKSTSNIREVGRGILRMTRQYPYWDVSWLVATIFTLGSVIWVINGFFAYLPLAQPSTVFGNEVLVGGGVSAFVGASVFEIGSVLLMIEAVNENQAGCFGMYSLSKRTIAKSAIEVAKIYTQRTTYSFRMAHGKGMLTSERSLGWAVDRALSRDERGKGKARLWPDEDNCGHHHRTRSNLVGNGSGMIRRHLSKSFTLTSDYCRFPRLT